MPLYHLGGKRVPLLIGLWVLLLVAVGCRSEPERLKIGDPAPDFTAEDLQGNAVSLADYAGKPVILRFWSTDCKYCRADTPIFNRYFDRYQKQGLRVVYINTESTPAEVRQFVEDLDIIFPVIAQGGAIAEQYNVKIVPQTIILDPEHQIVAAILGGVSKEELQDLLGQYL